MKNILMISLLGILWITCKTKQNSASGPEQPAMENHQVHDHPDHGLSLNQGAKWKSDVPTLENVKNLQSIVERAVNMQGPTQESYLKTAAELQAGLDKMIRECRMKGPDHDALHLWLEPLIQQVSAFKESKTTEEASANLDLIQKQIHLFADYFEG
ncbi:MAG TPA: hypothetical protein PKM27_02335 [Saprospiraceae bacterium]|nr:hypothetical protein [Saprospiraceae bacterium]HNT20660.1 hypothetical protein [Saprospiraceae bacterium]